MAKRICLLWIAAICFATASFAQDVPTFRLPSIAKPTHYTLDMTIVPDQSAFHGVATIAVQLKQQTSVLWLNQKGLKVTRVQVKSGSGAYQAAQFETPDEFLKINLPRAFASGPIDVEIAYEGVLNEKSEGAYRKKAGDDWYVYTSFTPIDARRAFPCFDEPGYKAPWNVTIHAKKSDIAVANGPQLSSTDEPNGMKRFVFKETQPLASEVVAFAVGPFDIVDAGVAGQKKIPVRIITPRGRAAEAGPAKAATAELLPREEAYTGIAYPWDKLDHIAVIDLPFGATENPGLITYRDSGLLSPVAKDTPRRIQAMRGTMAHEMAHQWFGNLVTQAWWDDTWLAEGFATWMAAKVGEPDLPENQRGLAMVQARDRIMSTDAHGKRPVRLEMHSRAEMQDVYSQMVYQKGGATLKLVEDWVGAEPFQRGIRRYLREHAMGNATSAELEKDLTEETGVNVTPVMEGMLTRIGYPVIAFKMEPGKLIADQKPVTGSDVWTMPICFHSDTVKRCGVINSGHTEIPIEGAATVPAGRRNQQPWVDTNAFGSGYYRSILSNDMLDALVGRGYVELSEPERLSLLIDSRAGIQ